jgi:hypothetical protein
MLNWAKEESTVIRQTFAEIFRKFLLDASDSSVNLLQI